MVPVAPPDRPTAPPPAGLPPARGPITERLFASLGHAPHDLRWQLGAGDGLDDQDDLHLALYCCYELHYRGLRGVDPEWEWEPSLLAVRRQLEHGFLADLRAAVGPVSVDPDAVVPRLWDMAGGGAGPSLSDWVAARADLEQLRELAIHRSAYQLKEADPHTWGIPRLAGRPKAAMVAIQAEEYGDGVAEDMHASLFAGTMTALGLDPAVSYLDRIPGVTLATTNLISLLGLHRRWRGAPVGHLALFEMTSVGPMSRYAEGLRRLGVADAGRRFYEVHVDADEGHQHVAADDLVAGLLEDEPELAPDVIFGAVCLGALDERFSRYLLDRWQAGRSSLRPPDGVTTADPPPPR